MATYRIQRILWATHFAPARKIHGLRLGEPTPRRETLARYIIRASFSQERMNYRRETGQVEYRSKDGKQTKVFDALEWPRQRAAGYKHWLLCAPTCPTRASRWLVIAVFIAMWRVENEKRQTPTIKSPACLNRN